MNELSQRWKGVREAEKSPFQKEFEAKMKQCKEEDEDDEGEEDEEEEGDDEEEQKEDDPKKRKSTSEHDAPAAKKGKIAEPSAELAAEAKRLGFSTKLKTL